MIDLRCPRCGSAFVSVARDMKSTRHCGSCGYTWLPAQDALDVSDPPPGPGSVTEGSLWDRLDSCEQRVRAARSELAAAHPDMAGAP